MPRAGRATFGPRRVDLELLRRFSGWRCSCWFAVWTFATAMHFAVLIPESQSLRDLCGSDMACSRFYSTTWLGAMDLADIQWRSLRQNLPLLSIVACVLTFVRRGFDRWTGGTVRVDVVAAVGFVVVLHGLGSLPLLTLTCALAVAPRRGLTIAAWGLAVCLLLAKDAEWAAMPGPSLLDWRATLKFVMLRLVSSASDMCKDPTKYTSTDVFAYMFYPPLWLAGPIISLEDYTDQRRTAPTFAFPWTYAVQFLLLLLMLEVIREIIV